MTKEIGAKISDAIEVVATPLARAMKLPCIDPETNQVRPDSPCGRTKANLHSGMNFGAAIWDGYFRPVTVKTQKP